MISATCVQNLLDNHKYGLLLETWHQKILFLNVPAIQETKEKLENEVDFNQVPMHSSNLN